MNAQFQIGRTYSERSLCDHDCIFSFTILDRTAKMVTVKVHGNIVRRKVGMDEHGVEHFLPFGRYSMCTNISAANPGCI